jgi:hypothetical protein
MTDFGGWEHATLVKFAGEAVAKIERMERALAWIEDKARARKLEIAPSLLGSGFEFGFWPTDPLHALAVLGEEFGELTKAMLQHTYEPHKGVTQQDIREEAIQTAAMALRLAMSLPCYQYRKAPQHSQGSDNLPDDYEV